MNLKITVDHKATSYQIVGIKSDEKDRKKWPNENGYKQRVERQNGKWRKTQRKKIKKNVMKNSKMRKENTDENEEERSNCEYSEWKAKIDQQSQFCGSSQIS